MVLLLSYMLVPQDHRFYGPDRTRLPAVLLSRRIMLVETKAITELSLGAPGLSCAGRPAYSGSGDGVPGQFDGGEGRSADGPCLCRAHGQPAGWLFLCPQPRPSSTPGFASGGHGGELWGCSPFRVLFGHCLFDLDRQGRNIVSTALAYNLMGALFGGGVEYNSMYFGFSFLYPVSGHQRYGTQHRVRRLRKAMIAQYRHSADRIGAFDVCNALMDRRAIGYLKPWTKTSLSFCWPRAAPAAICFPPRRSASN